MKIILIATFMVCVVGQTSLTKEAMMPQLRRIFNLMDTDDDGELVLSELQAYVDRIDTNGDGKMSYEEFITSRKVAGSEGPPTPLVVNNATFAFYDTVGISEASDGFMDRSDVIDLFNLLDQNGDSLLSLAEFGEIGQGVINILNGATPPPPVGNE